MKKLLLMVLVLTLLLSTTAYALTYTGYATYIPPYGGWSNTPVVSKEVGSNINNAYHKNYSLTLNPINPSCRIYRNSDTYAMTYAYNFSSGTAQYLTYTTQPVYTTVAYKLRLRSNVSEPLAPYATGFYRP